MCVFCANDELVRCFFLSLFLGMFKRVLPVKLRCCRFYCNTTKKNIIQRLNETLVWSAENRKSFECFVTIYLFAVGNTYLASQKYSIHTVVSRIYRMSWTICNARYFYFILCHNFFFISHSLPTRKILAYVLKSITT